MMNPNHIEQVDLDLLVALDALLAEAHVTRAAAPWHERTRNDPGHAWLRGVVAAVGRELKRRDG